MHKHKINYKELPFTTNYIFVYVFIHPETANSAFPEIIIPTMTPNNPRALPKISIIKILTNKVLFYASAKAAAEPTIPTHTLQI